MLQLRRSIRWTLLTAALAGILVASPGVAIVESSAAPPAPAIRRYVALGDSFTAGPLVPMQDGSWCFRSNNDYPAWVATYLGIYYTQGAFTDVSCSSATTANMAQSQVVPSPSAPAATMPPQLNALRSNTDLVTIGIGGNDGGVFGNLTGTCPTLRDSNPTGSPCKNHFTVNGVDTLIARTAQTQRDLEGVLAAIRQRSPNARVLVVGYPRLVPPSGYCDAIPFAQGDYAWADQVERALNTALRQAAATADVTYVDTYGPSLGHDACAGANAWVNGKDTTPTAAAYHPFAAGMIAEAQIIANVLGVRR